MMNLDFLGALLIGLMGAGHCIGMCGGVAAAVTIGMPDGQQSKRWWYLLCYNIGRIIAYTLAGTAIGAATFEVASIHGSDSPLLLLRILASIMMLILALHIGQWWSGITYIERVGMYLWRFISPMSKSLLPLKSPVMAIPFGFLWGWLPCGLVYSTLAWSAVSGGGYSGGIVMLAFGLGTLPAMLAVGTFANKLKHLLKSLYFRRASASLLLVYAVQTGYIAIKQVY